MTCKEYIRRVTVRAAREGYEPVDAFSRAAGREYDLLHIPCFARREGSALHVFGVCCGDGLVLEQLRTLSDQFHNAGRLALEEGIGVEATQLLAVLAYEKAPPPGDVDYILRRAQPRWPFGPSRSTPVVMDLSSIRVHRPWFPARAVSLSLLEDCARG